jgi:sterol desaturase/sphingolipid hydroxylase (fatty acid hydroxylase superfamily)
VTTFLISMVILAAVFMFVALLERVPALQHCPGPLLRPWFATDVAWYFVATVAAGVSTFVFRPLLVRLSLPGVSLMVATVPTLPRFLLAVAVFDGIAFGVHLGMHRSELLWRVHKVHHSSRRLDFLATTRTHAFELLIRNVPAQMALFALGYPTAVVGSVVLTYGTFAVVGHSNLRLNLRRIEWLFITPRIHRLHHVPATTQKNFATIFSVWDRATQRLVRADTSPDAVLGVPGEVETYPQRFVPAFREPLRQAVAAKRECRDDGRLVSTAARSD